MNIFLVDEKIYDQPTMELDMMWIQVLMFYVPLINRLF